MGRARDLKAKSEGHLIKIVAAMPEIRAKVMGKPGQVATARKMALSVQGPPTR